MMEIELSSVSVHGIRAARFEYSADTVRRDRCSYTPSTARQTGSESPHENQPQARTTFRTDASGNTDECFISAQISLI
ncbi:hypothetical protein D4100_22865 [Serratia inhibens]|uniref:Uncharacterized protein n=1 Tax=Serratia inhibens TaxID=2338073 RepID=A0AA92X4W0_9GAMM|nr:hypothetical protein D4100_22865 [Serratia inhibens]